MLMRPVGPAMMSDQLLHCVCKPSPRPAELHSNLGKGSSCTAGLDRSVQATEIGGVKNNHHFPDKATVALQVLL